MDVAPMVGQYASLIALLFAEVDFLERLAVRMDQLEQSSQGLLSWLHQELETRFLQEREIQSQGVG